MRLATIRLDVGTRAVRIEGDTAVALADADVGRLLARGDWAAAATAPGPRLGVEDVVWAPLVPHPPKLLCVGVNFADHAGEVGLAAPGAPDLFAKFARTLIGARDDIVLPSVSRQVDWEVELAVVVGRHGRNLAPERAASVIAGWSVLNDVSVRDWQFRTSQYTAGKNFERTCPLGPVLVTADELDATDLELVCEVDGEVVQRARTSQLVFPAADVLAYVSTFTTLEPGDVVSLGTPRGTAAGRTPPPWLGPGQVVRCAIEGIGELRNRCVAEDGRS